MFAMPDDIQIVDYAERVNRPGDFATLRQKNTDGMYKTLEQFENDVYMVFQKAMSINSQDTVPYKEATSLLEQAKQVFVSLKSNQMYSEPELLAWRQKHLDAAGPSKPAREQGANNDDVHAAAAAAATPAQQRPSVTPAKKKAVVAEKRPQVIKAGNASADKSRAKPRAPREGKTTPGTGKRARKAPATATATAEASGGARVAKRRLTYDEETDRGRGTTTPATPAKIRERHATLLYHPQVQGHTYQDSLRRFVRHAGLKARVAAEFRSLECETRARQYSPSTPQSSSYWSGLSGGGAFSPGTSAGGGYYRSYYPGPSSPATAATSSSAGGAPQPPECKLETDGLLRLVMLVGTPAFLERAKQAFGDLTRREGSCSKEEEQQQQRAAAGAGDEAKAIVAVTAGPAQRSTGGASDQGPVDFGPFAPPKLVPGRLGFGQFAGTSGRPFKLKPPPSKFPEICSGGVVTDCQASM